MADLRGYVEGMINLNGGGGGGSTVLIEPIITSGTKIADVTVDGVEKDLYAPTPTPPTPATEVTVTPVLTEGTKIATIGVDGVNTDLYAPEDGKAFSSDEVEDGTWFGEQIYRKSFHVTLTNTQNYIDVATLNIKNIIKIEGSIIGNNGYQIPFPYYETTNYFANFNYEESSKSLYIFTGSQMPTYYTEYNFTIYYTKNS